MEMYVYLDLIIKVMYEIISKLFKREEQKEYNDLSDYLEIVQKSEDWVSATFKEPQEDMDDELIYYIEERNLAFKFIIDEETNTVGMKKVDPIVLEVKDNKKSI